MGQLPPHEAGRATEREDTLRNCDSRATLGEEEPSVDEKGPIPLACTTTRSARLLLLGASARRFGSRNDGYINAVLSVRGHQCTGTTR
jgi:hypothetical protein